MAGEVEERILDAATAIFLQYGFAGASLEKIADAASASKATLYSRYSGKEALFSEVVKRSAGRSLQAIQQTPRADSLQEQLALATRTLVTRLLSDEVVGLIRMVVADAPRFPTLAKLTHDAGRLRAIDAVAAVIAEHAQRPRDAHTQAALKRQAKTVATQILDAIVAPLLMRAMLGHDLDEIRGEIRAHVKQALAIFMAAKVLDPFL
jgi:AcrR family transcriptional regulator